MVSRVLFSSARGDWETPDELYRELDREFHFTFDPCPHEPTWDALSSMAWPGRVFVNPPYGRWITDFFHKGREEIAESHAKIIVWLLPARTDTKWWHEFILDPAVTPDTFTSEIRFIKGRLRFKGAKSAAPFPSVIVVWRSTYFTDPMED